MPLNAKYYSRELELINTFAFNNNLEPQKLKS